MKLELNEKQRATLVALVLESMAYAREEGRLEFSEEIQARGNKLADWLESEVEKNKLSYEDVSEKVFYETSLELAERVAKGESK